MSSKVRWGESARAAPGRQRERARKREGGKTKGVDNDTRSLTLVHAQTSAYAQAPTSQLVKNSCGQNVGDELNVRPGGENGRVFLSSVEPAIHGDYHGDYCAREASQRLVTCTRTSTRSWAQSAGKPRCHGISETRVARTREGGRKEFLISMKLSRSMEKKAIKNVLVCN